MKARLVAGLRDRRRAVRRLDRDLILLLSASLVAPGSARAQDVDPQNPEPLGPVRAEIGLAGFFAAPVGEFADYVGNGDGLDLYGVLNLRGEALGLRLDLSTLGYGSTTVRTPLSPTLPGVEVDVVTSNAVNSVLLGPQLVRRRGPLEGYLHLSAGISEFVTTTMVRGDDVNPALVTAENLDHTTFAWAAGTGVRWVLAGRRGNPVSAEFGLRHQRHGEVEYLREGSLSTGAGGELLLDPVRSTAHLIVIHLGVAYGLR